MLFVFLLRTSRNIPVLPHFPTHISLSVLHTVLRAEMHGTVVVFVKMRRQGVKITRNPDWCLKTKPSVEPTTCLRESRNVRHFIDLVLRDVKWSNCFKKNPFPDVHNCARQDCHGSDIYKRRQSLVLPRSFNRVVYFRAVWNTSSLGSRNNWRGQHAGDPFTVILFLPELRPQCCDCRPQQ